MNGSSTGVKGEKNMNPDLECLVAQVAQLANDKAYAQDAMKTIGFVPDYETGPDTNAQVLQGIAVRPEIRAFIADYVKKGSR